MTRHPRSPPPSPTRPFSRPPRGGRFGANPGGGETRPPPPPAVVGPAPTPGPVRKPGLPLPPITTPSAPPANTTAQPDTGGGAAPAPPFKPGEPLEFHLFLRDGARPAGAGPLPMGAPARYLH